MIFLLEFKFDNTTTTNNNKQTRESESESEEKKTGWKLKMFLEEFPNCFLSPIRSFAIFFFFFSASF